MRYWYMIFGLAVVGVAHAQDKLPEPLDLAAALAVAENTSNPNIQVSLFKHEQARHEIAVGRSIKGFQGGIFASAEAIEPSELSLNQEKQDNVAGLSIRKRLLDFGRTRFYLASLEENRRQAELQHKSSIDNYKLSIMQRFFAVLLADLQYSRDNEAMAVAYVRWDKGKHRRKLGRLSDVELLKLQTEYQAALGQRTESQTWQNTSRQLLASLLVSQQIPADLKEPDLRYVDGQLPELQGLYELVDKNNRQLAALGAKMAAVDRHIASLRRSRLPEINLGMEAWNYNRNLANRDRWRAGVRLDWNLLDGGKLGQEIQVKRAQAQQLKAEYTLLREQLRETVMQTLNRWRRLKLKKQELKVLGQYRELKLDQHRALYELEVQTDLSDAMVKMSDYRYQSAKLRFDMALLRARLAMLCGKDVALEVWP